MSDERVISAEAARNNYGIYTKHELMPNGEARFRLLGQEGGYIRTVASETGEWQNAHKHKQLVETYVVESGWMGFADLVDGRLRVRVIAKGGSVASQPSEPHNVYLPAGAVVHTIKSGEGVHYDWDADESLTSLTHCMSESDIVVAGSNAPPDDPVDNNTKLKSMMDHYQNLDRLIWSVPTFFASGATILIGFFASVATRTNVENVAPLLISMVFLFAALLVSLSAFSIHKMSIHHALAGDEIFELSNYRYFAVRNKNLQNHPWRSAHFVFKSVFAVLAFICFGMTIAEIAIPKDVNRLIFQPQTAPENVAGDPSSVARKAVE